MCTALVAFVVDPWHGNLHEAINELTESNPHKSPNANATSHAAPRLSRPELRPKRTSWIFWLLFVAILCSLTSVKITPGGPFISIVGDIFPTIAILAAIRLGLLMLRDAGFGRKLTSLMFIGISTLLLAYVWIPICVFWVRPYSRGDLWRFIF